MFELPGFSRANSQGLRGLRIGGLPIGVNEVATTRPQSTYLSAHPDSAQTTAQDAPLESFGDQF
eukprot:9518154-Alexandrium_andersonii.AAC.1